MKTKSIDSSRLNRGYAKRFTQLAATCATFSSLSASPMALTSDRAVVIPVGYHHMLLALPVPGRSDVATRLYVLDWGKADRPSELVLPATIDHIQFNPGNTDIVLSTDDPQRTWTFSVRDAVFQQHGANEFPLIGISQLNDANGYDMSIFMAAASDDPFALALAARRRRDGGGPTPDNCCAGGPGSTSCSLSNGDTGCSVTCGAGYYACCLCSGNGCSCEPNQ